MEITQAERVLDVYGGDPDRWPVHQRPMMRSVLATSSKARACLRAARALDMLLDLAGTSANAKKAVGAGIAPPRRPKRH